MTDDDPRVIWDRICKATDPIEERDRLIAQLIDDVELLRRVIGDMAEESDARRLAMRYRKALKAIRRLCAPDLGSIASRGYLILIEKTIREALKEDPS